MTSGSRFGTSVAPIGDFNGDGVTDLAVGAAANTLTGPGYIRGLVYVLLMNASGTVASYQKVASGIGGGPDLERGDRFTSLASMGDIDGDKVTDLVVSTFNPDSRGRNQAIYVLLMHDGTVKQSTRINSDIADEQKRSARAR